MSCKIPCVAIYGRFYLKLISNEVYCSQGRNHDQLRNEKLEKVAESEKRAAFFFFACFLQQSVGGGGRRGRGFEEVEERESFESFEHRGRSAPPLRCPLEEEWGNPERWLGGETPHITWGGGGVSCSWRGRAACLASKGEILEARCDGE